MGIEPRIWGPHLWTALHLICEAAPAQLTGEQRTHYAAFFQHLAHVLPCGKCSTHLQTILSTTRPLGTSITTRERLVDWCIDLHNDVNADLGAAAMPVDDARRHWSAVAAGKKPAFPHICQACGSQAAAPVASGDDSSAKWLVAFVGISGLAIGIVATMAVISARRK
jgi:hypothetical protein